MSVYHVLQLFRFVLYPSLYLLETNVLQIINLKASKLDFSQSSNRRICANCQVLVGIAINAAAAATAASSAQAKPCWQGLV